LTIDTSPLLTNNKSSTIAIWNGMIKNSLLLV